MIPERQSSKTAWPLFLFGLAHAIIIFVLFNSPLYDHQYTASGLYFDYASRVFHGLVPYRDFLVEYPPVALVLFLLPRLFASTYPVYNLAFIAEIVVLDVIGLWLLTAIARQFKLSEEATLGVYTIVLVSTGPIVDLRYDIAPAIMMLAALWALYRGSYKTSWLILALGTMTKVYPLIIAPLFFLHHLTRREYHKMVIGPALFMSVIVLTAYPFIMLSPGGFVSSFTYQTQRPLQIESTYASVLLILRFIPIYLNFDFGGWNVGGVAADWLARLSTPLLVSILAALYIAFFWKERRQASPPNETATFARLVHYSMAAVVVFMVAGKVLSPQFIVWLYPLLPLMTGRWRYPSWATFVLIGLLTYYIFPTHYLEFINFDSTVIYVLLVRNILLIALGMMLVLRDRPQENVVAKRDTADDICANQRRSVPSN